MAQSGPPRAMGDRTLSTAPSGCSPYAIREAPLPAVEAGAAFPAADPPIRVAPLSDTRASRGGRASPGPGFEYPDHAKSWRTTSVSRRPPRCSIRRARWRARSDAQRFPEIGFEGARARNGRAATVSLRVPGSAPRWPGRWTFERLGNAALADRLEAVARQEACRRRG